MQNFININLNQELINSNKKFNKVSHPKITAIISVYNGEPYLKSALRSIQNQDFKSIEIIMIDDNSKDNSVKLIKELMKEDSRIVFLKNLENKGALYTKTKGALNARGKYILTLDVDDLYTSKNAFSILYNIAEKNKLDLLGFSIIISNRNITNKHLVIHHYWETEILYQPNVSYMMYAFDEKKNPKRIGDVISCYFMKRKVLVQSIKEIGEGFLNKKIIHHDDFFVFFMLSRKSLNLKQIKKPFYIVLLKHNHYNQTLLNLHNIEKQKLHREYGCLSYLYYIEFLLLKTENSFIDKQIPSYELENWYLDIYCRNNSNSWQQGIRICKLFLENNYINETIKNKIRIFLNEIERKN